MMTNHDPAVRILLAGGGAMGALMRDHDWSASPLGHPGTWPQSLRSIVGVLLTSKFPMFVAWGEGLGLVYNDPYIEILGAKHPNALGARFHDVWPEVWPDIGPLVDAAMAGQASHEEDLPLVINRAGFDELAWFTFSYSPVRDESGEVAGLFCTCTETTGEVLVKRRLRETEARASGVLEGMAEGFVLLDRDFRVAAINAEGMRLEKRSRDAILGRTHWEAWPGSEQNEVGQLYKRAMAERVPVSLEHRYVWPDGHDAWVEMRAYPSDDGLAVFYRDVTERKHAEARLQESEDHYRHAVEFNPQTVWTSGADGQLDRVGQRWFEWTGTSGLGGTWGEAIHPDDLAPSVEAWTRSCMTGEPYDIEHRVRMRDGSHRWMHSRAHPRRDEAGRVIRWYGTTEDVHEQRMAEQTLRLRGEEFYALADNIPALCWMAYADGHIFWYNRRWYEYTGASPESQEGWGWESVHDPELLPGIVERWRRSIATGELFEMTFPLRGADGAFRPFLTRVVPIRDEQGATVRWFGTNVDISE